MLTSSAMDLVTVLERFAFYRNARLEFRSELEGAAEPLTAQPGSHLFREGTGCARVALIGQGRVRVFRTSDAGREFSLYQVGAGEACLVNLLAILAGTSASATGVVEEPVHGVLFPPARFRAWLRREPLLEEFLYQTLARRFTEVLSFSEEFLVRNLHQRLADLLLRRFEGGSASGRPSGIIQSTHEEIAAELNTAREVVSRLLKEAEQAGALRLGRGRIELRGAEILRAWTAAEER